MKLGIIGLPNVGKSTLFNALTGANVDNSNYPFCTIEPNVGMVAVPDDRLSKLSSMIKPPKTVPAVVEFVDIAGLVKGSSHGEGLGNQFLSHIRQMDALIHVVRCFDDPNVAHIDEVVDARRDVEIILYECIFSDLEVVEKAIIYHTKMKKTGDKQYTRNVEFFESVKTHLEKGLPAISFDVPNEYRSLFNECRLLTAKQLIFVANMSESDVSDPTKNESFVTLQQIAQAANTHVIPVCAEFEAECNDLSYEDKQELLHEMNLETSSLERLIVASYKVLGLISFFTTQGPEVRAWSIKQGTKAPQAAGKIHSDFERGFIRAEVIHYDTLMTYGSLSSAKAGGAIRSEGKDYTMKDGDVVLFRFNV